MNDLPGAQRDAIQPSLRALFAFRKPSFPQLIWLVLSVLLFAALARWSMHDFPLAEMWRGLQSANMPLLGLAALTLFLSQSLRLLRWQRLLSTEAPLPVATTAKALMDGQMINWLSPIRVGDVWRVWQIASQANPRRSVIWAAVTILLEKSADSLVLAGIALALLASPLPPNAYNVQLRTGLVGLAGLLLMGGLMTLRPSSWRKRVLARLPASWQARLTDDRLTLPDAVQLRLHQPRIWLELLGLSSAIWLVGISTNVALTLALNLPLNGSQQLFFMLAIQLGLVLSTVPANIGLFPLVAMGVFSLFGLGSSEGIVFGSVLYALVYGVNTTLWLGWGWVARALTPQANSATAPISQPASITISGVRVDALTVPSLMALLTDALDQKPDHQPHVVMYANAHAINLAAQDPSLKTALNAADWVICDGWGLQWGAQFLGMHLPARLTPPDWVHHLTLASAKRDARMFLLGAQPGVAEAAARNFQRDCAPHALNIDTHHGYFEMHGPENKAVIDKINDSGAAVLLVGMGMPRQEAWIHANRQHLSHVKVIISVGALFNFVSGHMPRGPKWMTDNGLEWLFRLICEPGRLWRRYLLGNPKFILHVVAQKLGISKTQTK